MDIPDSLLQHTIIIEPYRGTDGEGVEHFGPAVSVKCFVDEKVRRVTSPQTGDEVISEATAYAVLGTEAPSQSRVTLPSGKQSSVIVALRRDAGDLPAPSHLEIVCG